MINFPRTSGQHPRVEPRIALELALAMQVLTDASANGRRMTADERQHVLDHVTVATLLLRASHYPTILGARDSAQCPELLAHRDDLLAQAG